MRYKFVVYEKEADDGWPFGINEAMGKLTKGWKIHSWHVVQQHYKAGPIYTSYHVLYEKKK